MEKMLKDRVALITGSGRGIGRETAITFAREGAKVVVSDIDAEPAQQTVEDIKKEGGEAVCFVGDATSDDFADGIIKTAADTWRALHIIVNTAGYTWDSTIHKMTDEVWEAMIHLHLRTPFRIIRAAAPLFRDAAKKEIAETGKAVARKIVNISSLAGTDGNPGQVNYSSAKAGLDGLTKTLSKEWGRYNVQANVVAFGTIDTRLTQEKEVCDSVEIAGRKVAVGIPKDFREKLKTMPALGRLGTTSEAAGAILFFASPLSDYVTGQMLKVSGGMNL